MAECDGGGRHPVTSVLLVEQPAHGCHLCCTACNVDRHVCPGCGEHLNHGVDVCLRCRNERR